MTLAYLNYWRGARKDKNNKKTTNFTCQPYSKKGDFSSSSIEDKCGTRVRSFSAINHSNTQDTAIMAWYHTQDKRQGAADLVIS